MIVKPTRKVRCPKCRSVELVFTETVEAYTEFTQTAQGIDREGIHNFGLPIRLDAKCAQCDHVWRVKRATQITNLTGEYD